MNFQVPQFIEVEDKVVGPLTFKQFVYLAGGGGLCFILYAWLGRYLGLIPIAAVGTFSVALAFYQVNDRPFINTVEAFIRYSLSNKLYIWKKDNQKVKNQTETTLNQSQSPLTRSRLSQDKLHELSWNLNIKEVLREKNN